MLIDPPRPNVARRVGLFLWWLVFGKRQLLQELADLYFIAIFTRVIQLDARYFRRKIGLAYIPPIAVRVFISLASAQ